MRFLNVRKDRAYVSPSSVVGLLRFIPFPCISFPSLDISYFRATLIGNDYNNWSLRARDTRRAFEHAFVFRVTVRRTAEKFRFIYRLFVKVSHVRRVSVVCWRVFRIFVPSSRVFSFFVVKDAYNSSKL